MFLTFGVLILFVVFVGWYLATYNDIVKALNAIKQAWSNVEVELKRRFDLIDNLVNIAKGYAKHERETLEAVTSLRGNPGATADAHAANASEQVVKKTIQSLLVVAEKYPDLKADAQFRTLAQELITTENRIAERRHAYNNTVTFYENLAQSFPQNGVFWVHDFTHQELFDAPDAEVNKVPIVKLV